MAIEKLRSDLASGLTETYDAEDLFCALRWAAIRGDAKLLEALLYIGADPNLQSDSVHRTPLHSAIEHMKFQCARRLLEHGADPNAADCDGWTPLHTAVDVEADSASQAGVTPTAEITLLLLEFGATPLARNSFGESPLDIARRYRHLPAIQALESAIECHEE